MFDPNQILVLIGIFAVALALGLGLGLGLKNRTEPCSTATKIPDLAAYRWIDLTYPFNNRTVYWPTSPSGFELDVLSFGETPGGWFYSANTVCFPEHGGTHLDAPIHFAANRWTTDAIPLERLNGPGIVIDITIKAENDADYRLSLQDVMDFEKEHGEIPAGAIVMLYTGWAERYYPDPLLYLGDNTTGDASNLHFPSYGPEAVSFLVEERKIDMLGVDTASIDYGASVDFIVHQIANGANIPGLENLANLSQVPATGSWIIALPMSIEGGSGGPVRVVALVP